MDEFDHIIDPPGQARKMVIGMLVTGSVIIGMYCLWYFLIHNENTGPLDHEGHFGCLFLHDNPILFAIAVFAVLVWASGTDR